MNIKISQEEHNELVNKYYSGKQVVFGSRLYGSHTEDSDTDIMMFYDLPISYNDMFKAYPNNHQFQYDDVENKTQYIWTCYSQFYMNMNKGDSTINADIMLFSDFFTDDKKLKIAACRTYKILKAYLGFAKRDLKQGSIKKINHAHRGLTTVQALINGEIPSVNHFKFITDVDISVELKKRLKSELLIKQEELRVELNLLYEQDKINLYNTELAKGLPKIWTKLIESNNIKEFRY